MTENEKELKEDEVKPVVEPKEDNAIDVESVMAALSTGDLYPNSIAAFKINKTNRSLQGGNLTRLVTALAGGGKILVKKSVKGEVENGLKQYLGNGKSEGDYTVYHKRKED